MQQRQRIVFGAGPLPNLPDPLFVVFVEPARADADTFYAEDPPRALAAVRVAYPDDPLIMLPPVGTPPPSAQIPDDLADGVVANLAELVAAPYFAKITDPTLLRRLSRASLDFTRSHARTAGGLFVAEISGASFSAAEVAVAKASGEGIGFIVHPGRGAFARMAQGTDQTFSPEGSIVLAIRLLPEWASAAAFAAYGIAIMPEPALVSGGVRIPVDDENAAILAAVAAGIAAAGEGRTDSVSAKLRRWHV